MAYVNKVHTVGFMRYTYSMIIRVMLHAFMQAYHIIQQGDINLVILISKFVHSTKHAL